MKSSLSKHQGVNTVMVKNMTKVSVTGEPVILDNWQSHNLRLADSERPVESVELQETVKTVSELDNKTVDGSKLDYQDDSNLDNATEATLPHLNTTIKLAQDQTTDEIIVATVEEILRDDDISELEDQVFEGTEELSTQEPMEKETMKRPNNKRLKFPKEEIKFVEKPRNPKTFDKSRNILGVDDKVDKNDVVYILYLEDMGRDE